jgi:hypothetical protein
MAGPNRGPLDWIRLGVAFGLILVAFVGGAFGVLRLCEEEALDSGIVSVCRDPTATDLVVIAAGVLVILLLAKEFQEIGLLGFSLKNRVERQEERTAQLESALAVLNVKVDTRATATANVTFVGLDRVREIREGAPDKEGRSSKSFGVSWRRGHERA